ncbi:unnamed protein product [Cyclocybe aegerita]|uniref:Uncharacterized protein n=1 Tax=Cyclocybe aegerita TaxID=1973307 RepID=A0A8S0WPG5_CYCAE|nr:unnamed protein product [Cyclocybe aegerita]
MSKTSTVSISPRLPPELEREIFEIAAYQDLGSAYQLLFVAKRVYQWIEPMVYRVMLRFSATEARRRIQAPYPLLERFETGQDPSPRLRQVSSYTTHLLLERVSSNTAIEFLQLHNNVQDLALWIIKGRRLGCLARTLTTLKLKRLSITVCLALTKDIGGEFDPALFPYLTHLELFDAAGEFWDRVGSKLHLLPCLSHLALIGGGADIRNSIDTLLRKSFTLRLLIIGSWIQDDFESEDPRVVVVVFTPASLRIDDWERGARGGRDLWIVAEDLQREREKRENSRTVHTHELPILACTTSIGYYTGTLPPIAIQEELVKGSTMCGRPMYRPPDISRHRDLLRTYTRRGTTYTTNIRQRTPQEEASLYSLSLGSPTIIPPSGPLLIARFPLSPSQPGVVIFLLPGSSPYPSKHA